MPFDVLKRKKGDTPAAVGGAPGSATSKSPPPGARGIPFDGLTEEWRIVGEMLVKGRLSDALNKRYVLGDYAPKR